MNSIRKWLYRPKKTDQSLLAQFFFADEDLNAVATELDSFDGRKDPDRCTALVNHLRQCQDKVLNICQLIMDEVIPEERAPRDFRAKFPDDVLQENLAGQLWFGAECLAAGSSILNRELESTTMRPLAKALTKSLENVRNLLREQCFRNPPEFTEKICESLKILDRLFAEFELSYVSAMVPVKSVHEYEAQQAITVLFSETLQRALGLNLLSQDQVDSCDPALMFTIPRLAIVAGLLMFPEGPLCLDRGELSDMFRPFRSLLLKIRELLWTLSRAELSALERALCSMEEPNLETTELLNDCKSKGNNSDDINQYSQSYLHHLQPSIEHPSFRPQRDDGVFHRNSETDGQNAIQDYLDQIYKDFPDCKQFISDLVCHTRDRESPPSSVESRNEIDSDAFESTRRQLDFQLLANAMAVAHANVTGIQALSCCTDELESSTSQTIRPESPSSSFHLSDMLDVPKEAQERGNENDILENNEDEKPEVSANLIRQAVESSTAALNSDVSFVPVLASNDVKDVVLISTAMGEDWRSTGNCPEPNVHFEGEMARRTRTETEDYKNNCDNLNNATNSYQEGESANSVVRPKQLLQETIDKTLSSGEEDLPTPIVEVSSSGQVFVESAAHCSKLHSSGSSQDSGLSSMADGDKLPSPSVSNETEYGCQTQYASSVPSSSCSSSGLTLKTKKSSQHLHKTAVSSTNNSPVVPSQSCRHDTTCSDENINYKGCENCDTSSFDSECHDDIEIALAMQAAEIATRNEARSRFKNSADLIHRLFICISGVADQLQTNYAADLRSTLKCVFAMNATPIEESPSLNGGGSSSNEVDVTPEPSLDEDLQEQSYNEERLQYQHIDQSQQASDVISPPSWVPDELAPQCMACLASFTVVRRRHHCRNCGKVFCGKCSGNSVPLPRYGHLKPVRVCNRCYMYCVTPFTLPGTTES